MSFKEDDYFVPSFTAAEETEYHALRRVRTEIRDALANLPEEQRDRLDALIGSRALSELSVVRARLCRVFPHLSDVIAYLCFPWRVQ